jgi:ribosomal protein S12 methylthiotransferase
MSDAEARPAVAFITLGCPKNEVDSDRMAASVSRSFRIVDDVDDADVLVVNTCSFIQEATEESVGVVLDVAGGWKTERAGRLLIVAGCMPSRYGDDLAAELPEVDAFVRASEEADISRVLARLTGVETPQVPVAASRTAPGPFAYLQVSDGCHRACTYCTIPAIRGPYVSRPADEVVAEAKALVEAGAKELVLIGQDVSSWGHDLPEAPTLA